MAEQVELQNATATLSQDGGWDVELITDGISVWDGWAIYDFGSSSTSAQTAVVETASDIGFASGSLLTFKLYHLNENPACSLGRFKLSYTTDHRDTFADPANSGGDVTANWVVITPHSAIATEGAVLTIQSDGSILASGTNPDTTIYMIAAEVFVQGITGFRIEAMADSSLPTSGPGRSSNGNFVLTEFEVDIVQAKQVLLQNPTATLSQDGGWDVALITDGDTSDSAGWAIYDFNSPAGTFPQTAVVETASDIGFSSGSLLTFTLRHVNHNPNCSLGRFKLLYTSDDRDTFADGQNSGGDVTATWFEITPQSASATEGAVLTIQSDGSILASGTNPDTTTYTVTAEVFAQGITGFRIEALADSSLPTSGPGRASNGNFVLTEFEVEILPLTLAPDRRITWDPGVRGGIPNRTTIYQTLSSSATAEDIQEALDNCPDGQVVKLNSGTYDVDTTLFIPSGVTLRGAGMGATILKGESGFTGSRFLRFDAGFDSAWGEETWSPPRSSYSLVSPTKGATTITTTAAHGWAVDDILLIDMLEQPTGDPPIDNTGASGNCTHCGRASGTRPFAQWVKVVSVPSTTTATIDPPLYWSYDNSPQAIEMMGLTHYAGVENLSVDNLDSAAGYTVEAAGAINCWLSNVELKGNPERGVSVYGALWFTMQGCRVTGGVPIGTDGSSQYEPDNAYGVFLGPHCSASLIADNIFEKLTLAISWEGAISANVFSYNFITDMWWWNTTQGDRRQGPIKHGSHPFMILVEGNWSAGRIRVDETWGTGSHFTFLRNRIVQVDRGTSMVPDYQRWTVDIERRNWYMSFIGNLLGGVGSVSGTGVNENNYEHIGENFGGAYNSDGLETIWTIGYQNLGIGTHNHDLGTVNSMIRWGNWCYRTNDATSGSGITYHADNVVSALNTDARRIPNSYYLKSKPAFFNGLAWPPYDPASPGNNEHTRIPAGYRYANSGANPP